MQYKYALTKFFLIQINYKISLCAKLGDYKKGEINMATLSKKNFSNPDEKMTP